MARSRSFRARLLALAVGVVLAAMPLAAGTAFAAGERTLNLTPEEDNSPTGTNRRIKAELSAPVSAGAAVNIDFEITGPNDPDGGNSPQTPDLSCTVPAGAVRCDVGYTGFAVGEDFTRGWIDEDGVDSTVEADMDEGLDDRTHAGSQPESDGTDVVETLWFAGLTGSTVMDCDPESASAAVGDSVRFECAVRRESTGQAVAGVIVDGAHLGGANDPDDGARNVVADYNDACTTGADGTCTASIPSLDGEAGAADICLWADEDADDGFHATEEFDGGACGEAPNEQDWTNRTDVVIARWRFDRAVTSSAPRRHDFGAAFRLDGDVSAAAEECVAGVPVKVTRTLPDGRTEVVGTATTDAEGDYSLGLRADRGAGYRASVAASERCGGATASAKQVLVRKKVTLGIARSAVERGRRARIRTRIAPCAGKAGQRVVLYRSTDAGRTFRRAAAKATNANCVAVFRPVVRRSVVFRAASPKQDADHLGGRSLPKSVTVR